MTQAEVAAFLSGARTLNVATLSPDGTIHLVAMWFVMYGTSPVFWGERMLHKSNIAWYNVAGVP
jgi:hypothetical protein